MFTGLIETTGAITRIDRRGRNLELVVHPERSGFVSSVGASVAVDGVCLTVESITSGQMAFTAVRETVSRTTLSTATPGRKVNLERALRLGDRIEGHLVLGHVDGIGRIIGDRDEGGSILRTIAVPTGLEAMLAEKGSVAVDGISLTIVEVRASEFAIAIVPHTLQATTMASKRPGDQVNLECDLLARYLRRLVQAGLQGSTTPGAGVPAASLLDKMEDSGW